MPRWIAVPVVALLVALGLVAFDPAGPRAQAFVECPPMSSLCNPAGLAVLAASASGGSLETAGGAAIALKSTAVGVGVTTGAVVGLHTWGESTVKADAGNGLATGGTVGDVGLVWTNGVAPGHGSSLVVSGSSFSWVSPNYGYSDATVFLESGSFTGTCTAGGGDPSAGSTGANVVQFYEGGATGSTRTEGGTLTCPNWGADTYLMYSVQGSATTSVRGADAVGVSFTYYPAGSSGRPAEAPKGMVGQFTKWMKCTGGGVVNAVVHAATWVADVLGLGQWTVPAIECPAGSTVTEAGVDWTPTAAPYEYGNPAALPAGGTSVVPGTSAPAWVKSIPTEYPQCANEVCRLELLRKVAGGVSTTCGDQGIACPEWYTDPARADNYECRWGPYAVGLATCSTFRTPGQTKPNVQTEPAPGPGPDPGTTPTTDFPPAGDPGPAPTPVPGATPADDSGQCFPRGWGALNPVEWVVKPLVCVLTWAFVPTAPLATASVTAAVTGTALGQAGGFLGSLTPAMFVPGGACGEIVHVSLPVLLGNDLVVSTCGPFWKDVGILKELSGIAFELGAVLIGLRMVLRTIRVNTDVRVDA